MPIRFRCTRCDQLMGIARRKAGTRVRCPSCQSEVEVPPEPQEEASPAPPPHPAPVGVFDRDDFDVLLQGAAVVKTESSRPGAANRRGPAAPPGPMVSIGGTMGLDRWAQPPGTSGSFAPAAAPAGGVVLSPLWATILTVAAVLLVASAFGAGVLVGRAWGG